MTVPLDSARLRSLDVNEGKLDCMCEAKSHKTEEPGPCRFFLEEKGDYDGECNSFYWVGYS